MKIYVASSWRNAHYPAVVDALRAAGHEVYDFRNPPGRTGFAWSELDDRWQSWDPADFRLALTHPLAETGYASDREAMGWADTCVCVLPCGRSAHLEAGWMAGRGKRVLMLVLDPQEPELMYKLTDDLALSVPELVDRLAAR